MNEAWLLQACHDRMPEERVDFKRGLPGRDDRGRAESLKDVCAYANADGGDLVHGVADEGGRASSIAAIVGESSDAAVRRLGQTAGANIEPPIAGLRFARAAAFPSLCRTAANVAAITMRRQSRTHAATSGRLIPAMAGISFGTAAKFSRHRHRAGLYCPHCHRWADLELARLVTARQAQRALAGSLRDLVSAA